MSNARPSVAGNKDVEAADQRIIQTVESLLREHVKAINDRDMDNDFVDRFYDPQFSAKLPYPMPPVYYGAEGWVNFFRVFLDNNPNYRITPLDWTTTVNDRRDKAEVWANWQFDGVHPGVVTNVSGVYTFRKFQGRWRIHNYEGWDNVLAVP